MNGPRYFIDGRPATVLHISPTGFITVVYDDSNFKSFIQRDDVHDWQPCDQSAIEITDERVQARAAELGIKI